MCFRINRKQVDRVVFAVLVGLLSVDAGFLLLTVLQKLGVVADLRASVGYDHAFANGYQYAKEATAAAAFGVLLARHRQPVYGALAATFALVLGDDALGLHERMGRALAGPLRLPSIREMEPVYVGELVVLTAGGLAVTGLMAATYRRSRRPARTDTRIALVGLGVLFGFGAVIDAVHSAFQSVYGLSFLLLLVEERGELVTMSLLVAAATWSLRRVRAGRGRALSRRASAHSVPVEPKPPVPRVDASSVSARSSRTGR